MPSHRHCIGTYTHDTVMITNTSETDVNVTEMSKYREQLMFDKVLCSVTRHIDSITARQQFSWEAPGV